jgi:hypothetical protein
LNDASPIGDYVLGKADLRAYAITKDSEKECEAWLCHKPLSGDLAISNFCSGIKMARRDGDVSHGKPPLNCGG